MSSMDGLSASAINNPTKNDVIPTLVTKRQMTAYWRRFSPKKSPQGHE